MKSIPVRHITSAQKELNNTGRFSIRKIEGILNGNDLQHDLHRHNFFFVLLIQSGKGIHEIDFTPHRVTDKSVFFLRPGQVHQLQLKAGTQGYLMEFDTEFYHPSDKLSTQRLRKASNKNFCEFESNRFQRLGFFLDNIFEECINKQEGYKDAIRAALELFFIEYVRQSENPESNTVSSSGYTMERLEEFTELLEKNIATQKQVAYYTGEMNLSSYQLNEITKKTMGKTASTLIDEYILLEAKRYLLATPRQVKDIAWDLGYEDPSYFIRFFKKQTGLTPELFRQKFK
ncbi:AraC family transcriptional regulator [Agriterribacter sp.]|uniref:AraC family transcriptional regulator n=1 Tax=Agriterribacter sp. TaxID=2821509 RepID=UPI002C515ACE|nr:AraC family transcriptional regulator [Agriterribacter sp.]HRO44481.1 AraC family transcriptional regulator [Agriterribacter sp.]HRQ16493.1 AraC family transcriptional regulator [Agriterribacter sp.]